MSDLTNAEFQNELRLVEVALATLTSAPLEDMRAFVAKAHGLTPRYKPELWANGGEQEVHRWSVLLQAVEAIRNATDGVEHYLGGAR